MSCLPRCNLQTIPTSLLPYMFLGTCYARCPATSVPAGLPFEAAAVHAADQLVWSLMNFWCLPCLLAGVYNAQVVQMLLTMLLSLASCASRVSLQSACCNWPPLLMALVVACYFDMTLSAAVKYASMQPISRPAEHLYQARPPC